MGRFSDAFDTRLAVEHKTFEVTAMGLLKKLLALWKGRKKYNIQDLRDLKLILLGGPSFLVAGYWTLMLKDVVPEYIKTVNKVGYIDAMGTAIGLVLLAYGIQIWFFGCIAARCHSVLYERWFK